MSDKKEKMSGGLNIYQKSAWYWRQDSRSKNNDPLGFLMLFPKPEQIKEYRSFLTAGRSEKIPIGGKRRRKNETMDLKPLKATRYLFKTCLLEVKGIVDNEGISINIKDEKVFDILFDAIYSHAEEICAQLVNADELDEDDLKN